ncbi:outer dense fiber protein 4 isoform X2 [Dipodomys merriami]|uniref:outer dense fiber protein 4 isoform X2 n=1 Tax=Dipodomys merriami TaxID=94247 RepID=UPI003855FB4D
MSASPRILSQTPDPLVENDLSPENIRRRRGNHSWPRERQHSQLPFLRRVTHTFSWLAQVAAAETSLLAFILLLLMVFSKQWLYPSRSRFFQRCPENVTNTIYSSVSIMSMGLMYLCKSKSCANAGRVIFIFVMLLLFPINLWIFELKSNVSIPIGWSYFIGWLVFILYVICGILCYLNHKNFWSLILNDITVKIPCVGNSGILGESLSDQERKTFSDNSSCKDEVLNQPHNEQPPASDHLTQTYSSLTQSLV